MMVDVEGLTTRHRGRRKGEGNAVLRRLNDRDQALT